MIPLTLLTFSNKLLFIGFPGFQIGSHVNDWNLDADELEPVFQVLSMSS